MYFSTKSLLSLAFAWFLQSALVHQSAEARTPCHICGTRGNNAMKFPHIILANVGKSCHQISLDVALNTAYGSSQCSAKQQQWAQRCCSGTRPAGRAPSSGQTGGGGLPPQNIPTVSYVGPHPPCKLCRDGDYPFAKSMVINFLYLGEGSCAQYYKYGLEGRIMPHMCDPVRFFAYEPCGCGQFNPYFNKNHPMNQQAQQAPSQNNNQNNNNNNNNNNNGRNQQRTPYTQENKDGQSMANQNGRGGSGGGGRRLKGSSPVVEASTLTVVEP